MIARRYLLAFVTLALVWGRGLADDFHLATLGGEDLTAAVNTTVSAGVGIRMQSPSATLVGKSDLNPNVCAPPYQSCQGLFRTQGYPAQHLAAAPGSANIDLGQGDLNYGKYSVFQAPLKLTSDLTLTLGEFGFFGRLLYFHDFINDNFTEYHANIITPQNVDQVGRVGSTLPIPAVSSLVQGLVKAGVPVSLFNLTGFTGRFYGPGGVVYSKRSDGETLREAGDRLQFLDAYLFGKLPLWDERSLNVKIGRQLVNWGESTTLVINSINSVNPVNANNYGRIGGQTEEVFIPLNMIDLSFEAAPHLNLEGYYQLEWQPAQAPAPSTYFSTLTVGTRNAGDHYISGGFGGEAQDPDCLGKLADNPLSGLTTTCGSIYRLPDWNPRTSGQFGIKLDYYAENLNSGTDFSFYLENYHSRLPYASFFSAYPSCARAQGNAAHNNATDPLSFLADCPHVPALTLGNPTQATSSALNIDSAMFVLEYPEDIHLIGLSFNTTVADSYALQGEVAYRPNKPMQVDVHDLTFAALGNQGVACAQPGVTCGSDALDGAAALLTNPARPANGAGGIGNTAAGGTAIYPGSNAVNRAGQAYTHDTFTLAIGDATGSQRLFPNFIIPYRGGTVGANPPCYPQPGSVADTALGMNTFQHPYYAYNRGSPCYIRGYEQMQDFEFNLGATRVYGTTDNVFGADQIIMLYEWGAEFVPGLPPYDRLVLEGPNSTYGPTAGADGSGADGSRMGCSNIPDCSYGPDGERFNPHQQDHAGYPTALSWGYRVLSQPKYEQILPGITLTPTLIWQQDIGGISPGPAGNFVKGRKQMNTLLEFRYHQAFSANVGYTWYWGGGQYNTLSDRDYAQFFLKYQF